jgi:hypothetical protein
LVSLKLGQVNTSHKRSSKRKKVGQDTAHSDKENALGPSHHHAKKRRTSKDKGSLDETARILLIDSDRRAAHEKRVEGLLEEMIREMQGFRGYNGAHVLTRK